MKRRIALIAAAAVIVIAVLLAVVLTPRAVTATGFAMGSVLTQTHWRKTPGLTVLETVQALEAELLQAAEP
ncbi:MAG: hypothetical protein FWC27_05020, partial [Firmicutes bacterium]|nr:hypothetical protein [Bacillota bacterium]